MVEPQKIKPDWNCPVVVAASGPSLSKDVAWEVRKARWFGPYRIVCVNDAYKLFPNGDILYACDEAWWNVHEGAEEFRGERWSSQGDDKRHNDDKYKCAERWGLNLVRGKHSPGFSADPGLIHYGSNSGFQAVNLAIHKGATKIVLVGFDMREVNGHRHFFGPHPPSLRNSGDYKNFIRAFEQAPAPVPIINATPGSALTCYPMMSLEEALDEKDRSSGHRPLDYPTTSRDCPPQGF